MASDMKKRMKELMRFNYSTEARYHVTPLIMLPISLARMLLYNLTDAFVRRVGRPAT